MKSSNQKKLKKDVQGRLLVILLLIAVILVLILGILLIIRNSDSPVSRETVQKIQTEPAESETENNILETFPETTQETIPETTEETLPAGTVTDMELSFYYASMHIYGEEIMPSVKMYPEDALDFSEKWESSDEAIASVDGSGKISPVGVGNCVIRVTSVSNPKVFAEINVSVYPEGEEIPIPAEPYDETDKTRKDIHVVDGITYVQGVMIVNKTYPLPSSYNTGGLTSEASQAFRELREAASEEAGLYLFSHSDFRSYQTQVYLYKDYCNQYGKEAADSFSARAGHSEHQTGLVIDVNWPGDAFNDTEEAKWLAENCTRFGFIIRFPKEKEPYTGYKYESWHIRYVGKEWAEKISKSGLCMEEYFHVSSEYAY